MPLLVIIVVLRGLKQGIPQYFTRKGEFLLFVLVQKTLKSACKYAINSIMKYMCFREGPGQGLENKGSIFDAKR